MKGYPVFRVLKVPENREKFFVYKERKEDKISMFKRLLLVGMLAVMLVSPGFAAVPSCDGQSCVVDCSSGNCEAKETQKCDYSTIGSYGGNAADVWLRAVWEPHKYSCGAGYYLKVTPDSAGCAECLPDHYCPRFTNVPFDESEVDYNLNNCPEGYTKSDAGAAAKSDCYKMVTVSCAEKNPYVYGNGVAVYTNEEVWCRQYYGNNSGCQLAKPDDCKIAELACAPGFIQEEIDGELHCVTSTVVCEAGKYLEKGKRKCSVCPENSFCAGSGDEGFLVSATEDQGITGVCSGKLKSPYGSTSEDDCGYVLHFGNGAGDKLYLHAKPRTYPSLAVQIDGQVWYADMTPLDSSDDAKVLYEGYSNKKLHTIVNGQEYTVHTSILE